MPLFSVVVATFDRGAHILPTLYSALEQSFRDFEIIVVGDGCSDGDGTLDAARAIGSPRISVHALATNSGSQSAPNNAGIAHARGRYIAYLGHDDVWHPDHLHDIADEFARSSADVVVAGCLFHGPPNSGIYFVTGLLDDEHPAADHFLPPSALAHTRDLIERIGSWPEPEAVSAPVDCAIMQRAARAGARFAATGKVTVHKFAAGHRYLSYLRPSSVEQAATLSALRSFVPARVWDGLVDAARRQGRSMVMKHADYDTLPPGHMYRESRSNKGLLRPPLRELTGNAVLAQTAEARALDWHQLEHSLQNFRWSGPSPNPRVLIPFTSGGPARVALDVIAGTPVENVNAISFDCDGRTVPHAVAAVTPFATTLELELPLSADDYTILGITTPRMLRPADDPASTDARLLGIALGDIRIEPQ